MITLFFIIGYAVLLIIWAVCIVCIVMHQRNRKHVSYGHYEAIQDLYGTEAADNYLSRH